MVTPARTPVFKSVQVDVGTLLSLALEALDGGRLDEAGGLAQRILAARPRFARAHRIIGLCHQRAGNFQAAEAAFRAGLKLDLSDEAIALDLAALLTLTDCLPAAETILRACLAKNRRSVPLMVELARLLTRGGKPEEALRLLSGITGQAARDHAVLATQAAALRANGQHVAALDKQRLAAELYPESAAAHHNLAANLGDQGKYEGAIRHAGRALSKGGQSAETWLVYARALSGAGRLEDAEHAFREAIARSPTYIDAHRELAQLVWMCTEDQRAATGTLDAHILKHPDLHQLFAIRASVLDYAGDVAGAYATLHQAIRRYPEEAGLHLSASQLAAKLVGGAAQAVHHAEHALRLLPGSADAALVLAAAYLAAGQPVAADSALAPVLEREPLDQRALAYRATAWRLLADPRYRALYDYAAFVRVWRMDTPPGWPDLPAYLRDLAEALGGLHPYQTHPLGQSVRHGSQATHLLASDNPVIRAFPQAVEGPIRRHLAALGKGADPLRRRNSGGYRYQGMWSVRLRPGGFHADHVHPEGWLSSACYIDLPPARDGSRDAWIKFGEPGIPTAPALAAEHFVEPAPGMLVLFPSYMWHGTVPFAGEGRRLSVAFDLVPG